MHPLPHVLYASAVLAGSWLGLQAVHELGHVLGALATGGGVQRIVLDPRSISRTEVHPNPHPAVVVWAGPVLGMLLPAALALTAPRRMPLVQGPAWFFAGACLVANGAYLGGGAIPGVGDPGVMRQTGTPTGVIMAVGSAALLAGLGMWHRQGSIRAWFARRDAVSLRAALAAWMGVALLAGGCAAVTRWCR